jgi:superfamily I DNA/RNA helicase
VIAGPGTGKSFGLQRRVARLLENGQNPSRILAVTFTRTAAQDLRNEINAIDVIGAEKVNAKTLHGFCFGFLNRNNIIMRTGRFPRPILEFEQKPMLYDLDNSYGILKEKQNLLRAFEASWACLQSEVPGYPNRSKHQQFERDLKKWLRIHKAMLYGEMIIEALHYLHGNPHCRELKLFDHILVDEYQDLNRSEQAVIDILAKNSSLAIIGDDDQSIYSFKFAHPDGIREFPNTHPNCYVVEFAECRRCPQKVVEMASKLISLNSNRTLGKLIPFPKNQDGEVHIVQWESLDSEIIGLSNHISKDILNKNLNPEDILVLVPVRRFGYRIRDELVKRGINAKSYFRETALRGNDQKYNFSLLNLMANPMDMVSWRFILGLGSDNYRRSAYLRILDYSTKHDLSVYETINKLSSDQIKIPYSNSIVIIFRKTIDKISQYMNTILDNRQSLVDLLTTKCDDDTEFRNILTEAINDDEINQEESINEWLSKVYSFVMERVSFPESTASKDHIRIMSLHASKGLSAKCVIVMSAIDELIPGPIDNSGIPIEKQIEEKRRLFYVAITRCKSSNNAYPGKLIISSFSGLPGAEALSVKIPAKANSWRFVSASQFINEFGNTAPRTIAPKH